MGITYPLTALLHLPKESFIMQDGKHSDLCKTITVMAVAADFHRYFLAPERDTSSDDRPQGTDELLLCSLYFCRNICTIILI